jgi:hypothetical protein
LLQKQVQHSIGVIPVLEVAPSNCCKLLLHGASVCTNTHSKFVRAAGAGGLMDSGSDYLSVGVWCFVPVNPPTGITRKNRAAQVFSAHAEAGVLTWARYVAKKSEHRSVNLPG